MHMCFCSTFVPRVDRPQEFAFAMVDGGRELAWCLESRSCKENRARDGKMRQSWIGFMIPTHSNKAWEKSSLDPCDWPRFSFCLSCSVQFHADHVALARRSSASGFWTGWSSWSWWGCWSWWSWPAKAIHTMSSVSEPYGSPAWICFCSTSKPCTRAFAPHLCHASIARKNLLLPWWREVVSLRDV